MFKITENNVKFHDDLAVKNFANISTDKIQRALLKIMADDYNLTFNEAIRELLSYKEIVDLYVEYYNKKEVLPIIARFLNENETFTSFSDEIFNIEPDFVAFDKDKPIFYAYLEHRVGIYIMSENRFYMVNLIIDEKNDHLFYMDNDGYVAECHKDADNDSRVIIAEAYKEFLAERELLK